MAFRDWQLDLPADVSISICHDAWDPSGIKNLNKRLQAKEAVDQGQRVIEFCMENYCNDHDDDNKCLSYIISKCRCSLKRLRIQSYYRVSGDKFIDITELTELEQVDLSWTGSFNKAVRELGRSCPRLKYFSVESGYLDNDKQDAITLFAIALYMPKLSYLRLSSVSISKYGLEAILVRCYNLENLNLHNCTGLTKDLLDMCDSKIKHFLVT